MSMRLLVLGKSRSGKSTALHRILATALRQQWAAAILLDGKGSEFPQYSVLTGVTALGPDNIAAWADTLRQVADEIPRRYAALSARGLRAADASDPRYLIVADEIQRGTRDSKFGAAIKAALQIIAEQSAALGDVLIISAQRPEHSVPPGVRFNCNAQLRMMGNGYFHLWRDGYSTVSGRVAYTEPEEVLQIIAGDSTPAPSLDLESLPAILGSKLKQQIGRVRAILYIGTPGSGKTHALHHYPANGHRRVFVSAAVPHRELLVGIIEQCGAAADRRATVPQLLEVAKLALSAEPTLLLVDDVHLASEKTIPSLAQLLMHTDEVAMAANSPTSERERRKIDRLTPYAHIVRIEPLSRAEARALAEVHLPEELPDRAVVASRIADQAAGNPATIVALARRVQRGSINELRGLKAPAPHIPLGWVIIVPLLALLIVSRWWLPTEHYTLSLALLALSILLRPLFYRAVRRLRQ